MHSTDGPVCIHQVSLHMTCNDCTAQQLLNKIHERIEPEKPMRYDIATDSRVPVTQKDWDQAQAFIQAACKAKSALAEIDPYSSPPWKFQLAVFPNPMRPAEAFIAEAKVIEPYPGLFYKDEQYFPPVPKTEWVIGQSICIGFAAELVRRWNRVPGQY